MCPLAYSPQVFRKINEVRYTLMLDLNKREKYLFLPTLYFIVV